MTAENHQDPPAGLTHLDAHGRARMVNTSGKALTLRRAVAEAVVTMQPATLQAMLAGTVPKGDVAAVVRVAGIQGAKRTGELIPLCHPLQLDGVTVDVEPLPPDRVRIVAGCTLFGRTGVEMEAMAAVAVAALTLYDMLKALDRGMTIGPVRLLEKSGGKSGDWVADPAAAGDRER